MNRVTTLLVVVFGVVFSACTMDKPGENLKLAQLEGETSKHAVSDGSTVFLNAEPSAAAVIADAPLQEPSLVERDAKVATEEAARKILDVTLGAAALIKEAGLSAVQAVREGTEAPEAEVIVETEEPVLLPTE